MYVPEHFHEQRLEVLQALVERHPLATLVAATDEGLTANHIPMLAELRADGGVLRGHIARGNTLWRKLPPDASVLAIFVGADSYVSPNWYPSKREHGKAVPTWNYATVHIHGAIRFIDDAPWLQELVTRLTDVHEGTRSDRWHVSDAPADYIVGMLRAIVGFEIKVARVIGKFKGSQNRSSVDRSGVRTGLRAENRNALELSELAPGADS